MLTSTNSFTAKKERVADRPGFSLFGLSGVQKSVRSGRAKYQNC